MSRVGSIDGISATWWGAMWAALIADPSGCWLWPYSTDGKGYGQVWQAGRLVRVHRLAHEVFVGPIPPGLEIDHTCKSRGCLRWDHLEAVTHRVNTLRGDSPAAIRARKTECDRGHALAGDNLYVRPDGRRTCRSCRRAWQRAWDARRKAAKETDPQPLGGMEPFLIFNEEGHAIADSRPMPAWASPSQPTSRTDRTP